MNLKMRLKSIEKKEGLQAEGYICEDYVVKVQKNLSEIIEKLRKQPNKEFIFNFGKGRTKKEVAKSLLNSYKRGYELALSSNAPMVALTTKEKEVIVELDGKKIKINNCFVQEKLTPLVEIINNHKNINTLTSLFNNACDIFLSLPKYGIRDGIFNFLDDYGLDKAGKMKIFDLGEIAVYNGHKKEKDFYKYTRTAQDIKIKYPQFWDLYLEIMKKRLNKDLV